MASIARDRASGRYRIRFRYAGRSYQRSLKTKNRREANSILGRVEETMRLIERGQIDVPWDADPGLFILSDGKRTIKPAPPAPVLTLAGLFELHFDHIQTGTKEESTIKTERFHAEHLLRHLKPTTQLPSINLTTMQTYVARRSRDKWHGKPISPETIQMELTTFRLVWNWAFNHGYVNRPAPLKGIELPKSDQKPPFMTFQQIETIIARGSRSSEELSQLWDSLFLTRVDTQDVLDFVRSIEPDSFIYPMFVFACHTGARRSEILRSEINDLDLGTKTIQIREKKKSRRKAMTFRRIPATELLLSVLTNWFSSHPGGRYTICRCHDVPLTSHSARHYFKRTVRNSKWDKIKGFHVFRHSFASNLAAEGIDQRVIDEWMGHQTEEMRKRYRHLFPDQQHMAIASVFGHNR